MHYFGTYDKLEDAKKVNNKVRELWPKGGTNQRGRVRLLNIGAKEVENIRTKAMKDLQKRLVRSSLVD